MAICTKDGVLQFQLSISHTYRDKDDGDGDYYVQFKLRNSRMLLIDGDVGDLGLGFSYSLQLKWPGHVEANAIGNSSSFSALIHQKLVDSSELIKNQTLFEFLASFTGYGSMFTSEVLERLFFYFRKCTFWLK